MIIITYPGGEAEGGHTGELFTGMRDVGGCGAGYIRINLSSVMIIVLSRPGKT